MKINDETIDRIAKLSRLEFTAEEKAKLKVDMGNILNLVDKLNELNTNGVEPLIHITEGYNVLREDVVKVEITKEEALLNAPKKDSDYFKVPKVVGAGRSGR
jgi:aspartyl-tRNA(Asn)/glutamyl-tRNA(Gln) amidotransferase subunit C